jgi:preprotein translocase subunit Sec61beta
MRQRRGGAEESSGSGLNLFFSPGSDRLKVGPTAVLVMSFVFMGIVVTLHILSKVKAAVIPGSSEEL